MPPLSTLTTRVLPIQIYSMDLSMTLMSLHQEKVLLVALLYKNQQCIVWELSFFSAENNFKCFASCSQAHTRLTFVHHRGRL